MAVHYQKMGINYIKPNSSTTYVFGRDLKAPTSITPSIADISASDSGNTDDGTMWKMRIGQKITWALAWDSLSIDDARDILTAFKPEYFTIGYMSPQDLTEHSAQFYCGDRSLGSYNAFTQRWENLSFNIIMRGVSASV